MTSQQIILKASVPSIVQKWPSMFWSNRIMMIRLEYMKDTNISFAILQVFMKGIQLSSSEVADLTSNKQSLVTVKRQLAALLKSGYLDQTGAGRSVKYTLSKKGWLLKPIDLQQYLKQNPDI